MTDEEKSNVALLRDRYQAWHDTKGDANIWLDILADHVDWGSLADGKPGMEFTKPRATKEEVIGYFDGLAADWDMEFYAINEYVAQDGRVVALGECSFTHKRTKNTVCVPKVDVWKLENGKVTQFMEHYDTHTILSAAQE